MNNKIYRKIYFENLLTTCVKHVFARFGKKPGILLAAAMRLDVIISYPFIRSHKNKIAIDPKKIVFMTNTGNYCCNPKYICEALLESGADYKIVWITDNVATKGKTFPANVKVVQQKTIAAFNHAYSAKLWIDNGIAFSDYFEKKKNQIHIQTMHGSLGIKRLDNAVLSRNRKGFLGRRVVRRESENTDLVITNSLFEENVFRSVFWKNVPMERLGHARTDILFGRDAKTAVYIRNRLHEAYGVPLNSKIVLYGPTHRKGMTMDDITIDYTQLLQALKDRFGDDFVVLLRLHNRNKILHMNLKNHKDVFDVTEYPDMQELMLVTDVAITDYSSWIYDYVVTHKYGFIYATDIERYNNATGLYYLLEETPFPVSYNQQTLFDNIRNFDAEKFEKNVCAFLEEKEAVDDGYSAERIVCRIRELMDREEPAC